MSNDIRNIAQRRLLGSPAKKAVMLYFADRAEDDGTDIFTSKANMAKDLELSTRTIQLVIKDFEERGLVREVGHKPCSRGFTINYAIDINVLVALPDTRDENADDGHEVNSGVKSVHPKRRNQFTRRGEVSSPNTSLEPSLEPSNKGIVLFIDEKRKKEAKNKAWFDEFWKAYPKKAGKPAAQKAYQKAIKNTLPEAIITGAKRYALWLSSGGPKDFRPEAKFPQGWLSDERWNDADLPELPQEKPKFAVGSPEDLAERRKRQGPQFGEVVR